MERLEYLLEQSKNSRPMAQEHKTEQNKIRGCVSNLWLTGHKDTNNKMAYYHDAESHMTKGTAKVILDMVHGEDAKEVGELNLDSFKTLKPFEIKKFFISALFISLQCGNLESDLSINIRLK